MTAANAPDGRDATIKALVRALEKRHTKGKSKKPLPAIPIGSRVRVRHSFNAPPSVGTVVGRDGYGFDGVAVIFDDPAPRGFEDGCCAGVKEAEILSTPGERECPTCGPTTAEPHPRRPGVTRCSNCKEWLTSNPATPDAAGDVGLDDLADWLGNMDEARNVFDITDEATTVITIDVETLAERILTRLRADRATRDGEVDR